MTGPQPPRASRVGAASLILALVTLASGADDAPPAGAPVPSDPVFSALLTDATTVSGRIRQLGPDGAATLVTDDGKETVIPLDRLFKLTSEGDPPTLPPDGPQVLFPEGDRLRCSIVKAGEAALDVQSDAIGDLAIPLESLLGVVFAPPAEPESLLNRVRGEPRSSEVLWLGNGDRLTGGYLGLGTDKVQFQPESGRIELPRAGLAALGFDPSLVVYPRPKGAFLDLTLADGSRLGVTDTKVEEGRVVGTSRFGVAVRVPIDALARVHVRGSSVAYLSERPESAASYVGYLGEHPKTYGRDATIDRHSIRLGGVPFDRGLGVRPRTLLAYKLAPDDRRFQALVGIDDRAGSYGNVVFRVLVDGKERFHSPPTSSHDTPTPIDVDVAGAKALILITEFGERGDVQDHADWVEARLVR